MNIEKLFKYTEIHQNGHISIEKDIQQGQIIGDLGIGFTRTGRIWLCIDGQAVLRFKPSKKIDKKLTNNAKT